ncbi:MAG: aspartate aminotransferase family protein [Pseudomonadota bacterium]
MTDAAPLKTSPVTPPAALMDRRHIFPTYAPPALKFIKGEGTWLTDEHGNRYLDFISGISVNTLGHAHPDLVAALQKQAENLWHLSNMFDVPGQAELAARYCELTFADRVFFTNSGAEAVECALKAARRYHFENGAPERVNIIGFSGAFHGRTYGAINAAGNPAYLKGFGPALPGYISLPFGDHDALKAAMDDTIAAVIVEPVQGEGGLRAMPTECLTGLRALCDETGALLIYDEVQCGAGRTGKLFAHEWAENAAPDIMAAAKGVGGGFPFGMCLASEAVGKHMVVGTHGSTYGGNALAMAVGHAVLDHLGTPEFLAHVRAISDRMHAGFQALVNDFTNVLAVRGKGLLSGCQLDMPNTQVRDAARERGLLIGVAGDNVIRLAPPLNASFEEVDEALTRLRDTLKALHNQ